MKRYYRNCNELPIYNFYKIVESTNLSYLYVDYDEYNDIRPKSSFQEVWKKIYDEYSELTGDRSTLIYYELISDIMYYQTRYNVVSKLLDIMSNSPMTDEILDLYIAKLKEWKYVINKKKPLQEELQNMYIQLKQSENKIRMLEAELEALKKKNKDNKSLTLTEQQVKLEQGLGRNEIDVRKVSVAKWLMMIKEVKEINRAKQKQMQKNGK
jgi:hypothetical protein